MKSLYDKAVLEEVLNRIEKITPETKPLWGKMNAAQMFKHNARTLEYATGRTNEPRLLIGRILAPFFKSGYYNDKPWPKNSPTAKSFMINEEQDFNAVKQSFIALAKEFSEGGPEKCTTHPSPFYGKLTPEQIGLGQYKHIDHHLQQFGV